MLNLLQARKLYKTIKTNRLLHIYIIGFIRLSFQSHHLSKYPNEISKPAIFEYPLKGLEYESEHLATLSFSEFFGLRI